MDTASTAQADRNYICQIGRLFWGDDKQCYSAYAVYAKVKELVKAAQEPPVEGDAAYCAKCGRPITGESWHEVCEYCVDRTP